MTRVIVEPDESFESALKRFKKQCEKAGLLSEFKKRQHYEKPSVKRKRKIREARKRRRREAKRKQMKTTGGGMGGPGSGP